MLKNKNISEIRTFPGKQENRSKGKNVGVYNSLHDVSRQGCFIEVKKE